MSVQIAVRLPDDIAEFVDEQVRSGAAASRAAIVVRALQRERAREAAEQDARIYADAQPSDLDDLAAWSTPQSLDVD
jgi:Arc/MetJ-type ribon-helix-helix transcriptional regulator